MKFLLHLFVTALVVLFLSNILTGVHADGFWSDLWAELALGILNAILRSILIFLSLPITVITLGLFLFVINALIILLTSSLVNGFEVLNFWWALLFSLCLSFVQSIIGGLVERSN